DGEPIYDVRIAPAEPPRARIEGEVRTATESVEITFDAESDMGESPTRPIPFGENLPFARTVPSTPPTPFVPVSSDAGGFADEEQTVAQFDSVESLAASMAASADAPGTHPLLMSWSTDELTETTTIPEVLSTPWELDFLGEATATYPSGPPNSGSQGDTAPFVRQWRRAVRDQDEPDDTD
ncbi:MAG: hypothetical protein AAGC55_21395, partial [Myxococcota bacterium]